MSIVELFKYNSLVSIPLFLTVAFLVMRTATGYSHKLHTISKSVEYYPNVSMRRLFNGNFLLKALIDYGFLLYLIVFAGIAWNSLPAVLLFMAISMFGMLGVFTEGSHSNLHRMLAYTISTVWTVVEILLAQRTGNALFILFTYPMAIIPTGIAYLYLFKKTLNVYMQLVIAFFIEAWLCVYVFVFL